MAILADSKWTSHDSCDKCILMQSNAHKTDNIDIELLNGDSFPMVAI